MEGLVVAGSLADLRSALGAAAVAGQAVSIDMNTGDMAVVELDVESAPRPRNRAERRAEARRR